MRLVKGRTFSKEPWYGSYRSMLERCNNPNAYNYHLYGGRGIKVCDEWLDIEEFEKWVLSSNYQKGLSIERIDVNGNYEPSNCTWATSKEQANNRRNTIYVTIDGITKTLSGWADFSGISRSTLNTRYGDGIRGVMLLHKAEDTTFKNGYNRYENSAHYDDMKIANGNNEVITWSLNGEEHTIAEWSEITGISQGTFRRRKHDGWSIERILTTPPMANKYSYKDGTLVKDKTLDAPTIIPATDRMAVWKRIGSDVHGLIDMYECSNCGANPPKKQVGVSWGWDFVDCCPKCGAKIMNCKNCGHIDFNTYCKECSDKANWIPKQTATKEGE